MRARLLYRSKLTDGGGDLVEMVVWSVPADGFRSEGVRYRLAFVPRGQRRPAVLYDNHHPKGHHKHVDGRESPYAFVDVRALRADFLADVDGWRARRRNGC